VPYSGTDALVAPPEVVLTKFVDLALGAMAAFCKKAVSSYVTPFVMVGMSLVKRRAIMVSPFRLGSGRTSRVPSSSIRKLPARAALKALHG